MELDLTKTYEDQRLKNLPHRKRLNAIFSILEKETSFDGKTFADVGCHNGYVTDLIARRFNPAKTYGFDHDLPSLEIAKKDYPEIVFDTLELNTIQPIAKQFDIVTCFESLEHVGDLQNALENLVNLTSPGGLLLISAPVEVGVRGIFKFLAKTTFYGYKLDELPPQPNLYMKYLSSLFAGKRMSAFRDQRTGWGTHFGFDYRDIDAFLRSKSLSFRANQRFTTRFYLVRP